MNTAENLRSLGQWPVCLSKPRHDKRWPICLAVTPTRQTTGRERGRAMVRKYHWRELPQVSFLSRQKFCRRTRVCRDKTRLLSRQKYACRDKTFVVTNISPDKHKLFSRQAYFCRDKITFVATSLLLSQQICVLLRQTRLVSTKVCLSRQKFYSCKHTFVATKDVFCPDKRRVLSRRTCVSSRQK